MPSASELLALQTGGAVAPSDNQRAATGIDVEHFLLDVVRSKNLDIDVAESILSGRIERTMDGASTITVTINDNRRVLLKSDIWDSTIDLNVDGNFFRLVNTAKMGDTLTLTFEDRIVSLLRSHKRPLTVSRNSMTRAQFIQRLVREVKIQKIRFYTRQLKKRQPIAKGDEASKREKDRDREKGLEKSVKIRVKGARADREQIKTAEIILDTGVSMGANRKVLISAIMVAIVESELRNLKGGDQDSRGAFQQQKYINGRRSSWPASGKVDEDAEGYFKAAIALDNDKPNLPLWQLCADVQRPREDLRRKYDDYKDEAKNIFEEYGELGSAPSETYRASYQFSRGEPQGPKGENSWEAMIRLAEEVRWRIFVVGNTVYYMTDADILASRPRMIIAEDPEPDSTAKQVDSIDFDWDSGKPENEAMVTCTAERWVAPPGTVVVVEGCGKGDGRWIVTRIERDLFSTDTTINMRRPQKPKKEPAPDIVSRTNNEGDESSVVGGRITGGNVRERIVQAAERALADKSKYTYKQYRPMANSLFSKDAYHKTDCSAFVTLCYKAAGAPNPNTGGFEYDGSGYTGSMLLTGKQTQDPEPGDLAFWGHGNLEHVGIYIGDGMCISFGSNPIKKHTVNYRNDFRQFRTYDLQEDPNYNDPIKGPDPNRPYGPSYPSRTPNTGGVEN